MTARKWKPILCSCGHGEDQHYERFANIFNQDKGGCDLCKGCKGFKEATAARGKIAGILRGRKGR